MTEASQLHLVSEPTETPAPDFFPAGDPLTPIINYLRCYMVMPEEALLTCALWILHTYTIESAEITPYLHPISAERESGKTTLRDLLGHLCARPWSSDHVSAAGLRRSLNAWPPPTFLLDEADGIFAQVNDVTEALRSVLNAGFRRGATVSILVHHKSDWEMEQFSVFGPKVIVSIGELPDTIESRCIPIRLQRKRADEEALKFRLRKVEQETTFLKTLLQQWADEHGPLLMDYAEPQVPAELTGRQADCWEHLLAIAEHLGGEWPERARCAAVVIHSDRYDESPAALLLRDIKAIFDERATDRIYSLDLVRALVDQADLPWVHAGEQGRPLDASILAQMLRSFSIRPKVIRIGPLPLGRGYNRFDFEDAWARYAASPEENTQEN